MPNPVEIEIGRYRRHLLAELASGDHGRFFPLRLMLPVRRGGWIPQLSQESERLVSFDELIDRRTDRPLVITGDPGSGKTTLLESFARERLQEGDVVFFLRMGLWARNRPMVEQLTGRLLSANNATRVLRGGNCWILFDALDEVRDHDIDSGFQAVLDFHQTFPRCRVVSSCRGAQLPPWASLKLDSAIVQPLSQAAVEMALGEALEKSSIIVRDELKELCRNPLMLSMTQELLLAGDSTVLHISSPSQIYELFITLIDARERGRRPGETPLEREFIGGLNLKLLGFVAWKMMENAGASASEEQMAEWLQEVLTDEQWSLWFGAHAKPSPAELLAALMDRAPLKQVLSPTGGHPHISFMHLTFRDAFAGRHLRLTMRTNPSADSLVNVLLDERRRFWGAVLFVVGTEERIGSTSRLTMDIAFHYRRQELLVLAAQAVADRWDIDADDIGDLAMSIMEAFKNWDRPFDYELVRAGRGLIPRLGPLYPDRLREDLLYFTDKYASVVPRPLVLTSVDKLLNLLNDKRQEVVVNALHTLATKEHRSASLKERVARVIVLRLPQWSGSTADQAVAALKDLGATSCLPALRTIARDPVSSHRSRAFAANGIAQMGDRSDLGLLQELLFDRGFRYRDSASWSLQMLARRVVDEDDSALRQKIVDTYMSALVNEVDDPVGRYAKGNILYSLGVLKVGEHRAEIEGFLLGERDAYVIEDGIFALGLIGDPRSEPLLRRHLRHADPAIRLKAAESLFGLGSMTEPDVALLRADPYRIVCRVGEAMDRKLKAKEGGEVGDFGIVSAVLGRGAVRADDVREIFRIHPEERAPIQRVFEREMRRGSLKTHPRFIGHGSGGEVRISHEDAEALRKLCAKR